MTEEEEMLPRIKRVSKEKKRIHIPVLNIILILFGSFLLMVATFVQLNLTHFIIPHDLFSNHALKKEDFFYTYSIIPQIPSVLFVVGMLGRRMGLTSILLYILVGICFLPIFALGGGIHYLSEAGFGYIMAYIPAAIAAGLILENGFSFKNILKATLAGVLIIHFIGVFYMLIVAILKHEGWAFIKGWIISQSMLKIAYDYALSAIALFIAKYINRYIRYLIG